MQATRISELAPRSVWDIVDDAFDLYRERFVLFLTSAAVVYVPLFLVRLFYMAGVYRDYNRSLVGVAEGSRAEVTANMALALKSLVIYPFYLVAGILFTGLAAVIVEDALRSRQIQSVGQVLKQASGRIGILLLAGVLTALATAAGFLFFFLPALYVAIAFTFVPVVLVMERRGLIAAFQQSNRVALPEFATVFGMTFLLGIIAAILSTGASLLLAGVFSLLPQIGDSALQATRQNMLGETINGIVTMSLSPLGSIALILLYYDFRVRREGLDMVARAEEIGFALAPDPFGEMGSQEVRRRQQRLEKNRR